MEPARKSGHSKLVYDKAKRTIMPELDPLEERALAILHRMATENTGWSRVFKRWYYHDEPLRHDAANLVREARFDMMRPINTKLVE